MILFEYVALLKKNCHNSRAPEIIEFLRQNKIIDPILSVAGEYFWEDSAIKDRGLWNQIKTINAIDLMCLAMRDGLHQDMR